MMSLMVNDNPDIQHWLPKVTAWQETGNTFSTILEQAKHSKRLTDFLRNLAAQLKECKSVTEALEQNPEVGQLLGRLSIMPCLLLDISFYQEFMKCLLFFYKENPLCPLEMKSKSWVLSQIQNMVSQTKDANTKLVLHLTGKTLSDFHSAYSRMVSTHITELFQSCSDFADLRSDDTLIKKLQDLNQICFSLRHIGVFGEIMYFSLHKLMLLKADDVILEFLQNEADLQFESLPYKVKLLLWTCKLSLLEKQVLDITSKFRSQNYSSLDSCESTHHLVQGAAENIHIYHAVFDMLQALLVESEFHLHLVCLIGYLHGRVRKWMEAHSEICLSIRGMYPSALESLVTVLSISPESLPAEHIDNHLILINSKLELLDKSDHHSSLTATLAHYFNWCVVAFCRIYKSSWPVFSSCLGILSSLHSSHRLSAEEIEALEYLRNLYYKVSLSLSDVFCALGSLVFMSGSQCRQESLQASPLLCQLLLVFCVLSVGGPKVLPEVISLVCSHGHFNQLDTILGLVECLQTGPFPLENTSDLKSSLLTIGKDAAVESNHRSRLSFVIDKLL